MGSGKTTLGKKLANMLSYNFIDLDQFIEIKQNKTVEKIFSESGETVFRKYENEALEEIAGSEENIVVATGGGAPCFNKNMEIMNQTGVTVYLKYKAGFLLSRIQQSKKPRPLLLNVKDEEKLNFITNLLEKRENIYQKSRIIVENDRVSLEYIHEKLKDFIV